MRNFKDSVVKALLPHIILTQASKHGAVYGYGLIVHIRRVYGVYLGASTVYPAILTLQREGLLQSQWDTSNGKPRRVYILTQEGRRRLGETTVTVELVAKSMIEVKA